MAFLEGLPDSANKHMRYPVKYESQMNEESFFYCKYIPNIWDEIPLYFSWQPYPGPPGSSSVSVLLSSLVEEGGPSTHQCIKVKKVR